MADIMHSLQIAARPEQIWPLVSTGPGMAQWWAADVSVNGDTVELGFFKRNTMYRLRPLVNEPNQRMEWRCETGKEWSGTRIVFQLLAMEKGTLVKFKHAEWEAATDYFVSCNTVWGALMFRLKSAAEGKPAGPLFTADAMAY